MEVTVWGVSQSQRESDPQTESSVCTAAERVAMTANWVPHCCTTEPLGRTGQLSVEPVLHGVSFFGATRCDCCLSGHLSAEPAVLAAVLLASSILEPTQSHFSLCGRLSREPAGGADVLYPASSLGMVHSHSCSSSLNTSARSQDPAAACSRTW